MEEVKKRRGRPRKYPIQQMVEVKSEPVELLDLLEDLPQSVEQAEPVVDNVSDCVEVVEPTQETIAVGTDIEQVVEEVASVDEITAEETIANEQSVVDENTVEEQVVYEDPSQFMERRKQEVWNKVDKGENFSEGDFHYICYKFAVGTKVWVPVSTVKNIGSTFGSINAVQLYEPKCFTISSVMYTNHITYHFKETGKVVAAENFVFLAKELCEEMCAELNKR